jgi:hypothetical protein
LNQTQMLMWNMKERRKKEKKKLKFLIFFIRRCVQRTLAQNWGVHSGTQCEKSSSRVTISPRFSLCLMSTHNKHWIESGLLRYFLDLCRQETNCH